MVTATTDIRGTLLSVIYELQPKDQISGSLQIGSVLHETAKRIGAAHNLDLEQALLTQLHDLFRTGYLAWGFNIGNPNPPFFHITAPGRNLLANLSRDPANPDGYLKHLNSIGKLNDVGRSYLEEGLACYVAGMYKAAAVMVGAASESVVLELRDVLVVRISVLGRQPSQKLTDWRVKVVLDSLYSFLSNEKKKFSKPLREEFEAYWSAFVQQIRAARNDAGHPMSVEPVTLEAVHASLLILPELTRLQNRLCEWITKELT